MAKKKGEWEKLKSDLTNYYCLLVYSSPSYGMLFKERLKKLKHYSEMANSNGGHKKTKYYLFQFRHYMKKNYIYIYTHIYMYIQ